MLALRSEHDAEVSGAAVTMIVPFSAGGPTDSVARIVGRAHVETLGQQIVIENVTGAGGTTGTARAAQATPDGYTIMMGHMGTHGAAPAMYPKLRYDPTKDFEPVGSPPARRSSSSRARTSSPRTSRSSSPT